MILPDVNVLIYAFRRDLPQHTVCCWWLAGVVMSDARFGLSPLVLGAVVRVTTNPRVYRTPSTIEEERHWDIFKRLCIETETRGSPVTDACCARAISSPVQCEQAGLCYWFELLRSSREG